MSSDKFCLYCANWAQLSSDRAVGKCSVYNGYRLQYEDCARWAEGDIRIPYREKVLDKKERNRSRDDEIERLILSGNTIEEARITLHCGRELIRAVVKERNLTLPQRKKRPKKHVITGDIYEQVVHYYKDEKRSQRWIADKVGYTVSAVRGALVRAGLAL